MVIPFNEEKFMQFIGQIGKVQFLPLLTVASPLSKEYGLTDEHIIALGKIVMTDDPFVSYIASALYITTSKASRLVKHLEEINHPVKGKISLVKRKYGEAGDRRKIKLEPTEEGKELFASLWADLVQLLSKIMKKVGVDKIEQLSSILEQFNDAAEEEVRIRLDPEFLNKKCKE